MFRFRAFAVRSSWRYRLPGLALLVLLGLAVNPLVLHSSESDTLNSPPETAAFNATELTPTSPGPYHLTNVSYAPGRKLLVGMVDQQLVRAVKVKATDEADVPVAGVPIAFEILSRPEGDALATVTTTAYTDAEGIAVADVQLGGKGRYLITARTDGMISATPRIGIDVLAPSWWIFVIFGLIGGLGMFLYGMELGSGGLQKVAGDKMRSILGALTKNRFMGVILGTFVTAVVQSSTATTVMVIGFVSAGLLSLMQSLGVIMGANIGTTVTVQLIAFKLSDYALLLIGGGVIMTVVTKRKMYIYIGEIILAFGLIFYGMAVMSSAVAPLRSMPGFSDMMMGIGDQPLLGVLISIVLTAIMHSGAVVGLVIVLSSEGLINLTGAIAIVFGANIGTTVTTLLATIGASTEGKRTGLAHFLFNVIGVVIFFPLLTWYVPFVEDFTAWLGSSSVARQVANGHMVFNVAVTLLFMPFLTPLAKLVEWVIPRKEEAEKAFGPKYLNNDLLETPEFALAAAWQELLRLSGIVGKIVRQSVEMFGPKGEETRELVRAHRNEAEILASALMRYQVRLAQKNLGLIQSREKQGQVGIIDELRQTADYFGIDAAGRAEALGASGVSFSEQGLKELNDYLAFTLSLHDRTATAMHDRDAELAREIRDLKDEGESRERGLRESHMGRLDAGLDESIATSAAHMDLLSGFRQTGRHYFRICRLLEEFLTAPQRHPAETPAEEEAEAEAAT